MKNNKPFPDLPDAQRERVTEFAHDQAAIEGVTPAAMASRIANDPDLLKKAIAYERPKPAPSPPPAAPAEANTSSKPAKPAKQP